MESRVAFRFGRAGFKQSNRDEKVWLNVKSGGVSSAASNDGERGVPQEIFAFRSGRLGRFHKVFETMDHHYEGAEAVGMLLFAPRDEEDQKSPLQTAIFYSANEERISLCRYTLKMNGIETTLEKEVYPGRDFIITVPGVGKKDGIEMKLLKHPFTAQMGRRSAQ